MRQIVKMANNIAERNKAARIIFATIVVACVTTLGLAQQAVRIDKSAVFKNAQLISNLGFQRSISKNLKPKTTQATADKSEDGPPSGPSKEVSPTYLADKFEAHSPKHIREDFLWHIPFSDEIFRDHTSLNTFYFYPAGYLLKHDRDGFDINFLHRTRVSDSEPELVVLTFTLQPRKLYGGMNLLNAFTRYAIKTGNGKPIELNRLPISDVKVNIEGMSSLISEQNIIIVNSPQKVGDPIRVQATMTQSQKEDVVASIRSGGLTGDIEFSTNNKSFQLVIPYYVSFVDYSGEWMSEITELSSSHPLENQSPYPLLMSGIVVYAKSPGEKRLKRHQINLATPVVMDPGASAITDKSFQQLVESLGDVVAAWPQFERISCEECLNAIEREILVSPAQASRTSLPIEAIPNIFSEYSLFKVLVEVRSNLFSPAGQSEEVKAFTIRPDQLQISTTLYVNRDAPNEQKKFEYRIKPFHLDGLSTGVSSWIPDQGVMDITITAGEIGPLMTITPQVSSGVNQ